MAATATDPEGPWAPEMARQRMCDGNALPQDPRSSLGRRRNIQLSRGRPRVPRRLRHGLRRREGDSLRGIGRRPDELRRDFRRRGCQLVVAIRVGNGRGKCFRHCVYSGAASRDFIGVGALIPSGLRPKMEHVGMALGL
eukprot:scaffold1199_cov265-Pinguiococcus_pyrenoidosus.AAC.13